MDINKSIQLYQLMIDRLSNEVVDSVVKKELK